MKFVKILYSGRYIYIFHLGELNRIYYGIGEFSQFPKIVVMHLFTSFMSVWKL